MPARRLAVGGLLIGTLCLGPAVAAQGQRGQSPPPPATSQAPPPTFRSQTVIVPVDVRVIDSKTGKPVIDLTQADFTVSENGVRQEIRHFSHDLFVAEAPGPTVTPARTTQPKLGPAIAPDTHRTFLIVLGRGLLQIPAKGVDGMIHLVRDRLLPQDRVAVFAWDRSTEFTTDHEAIVKALERFKREHAAIELQLRSMMSGLAAVYGSKDIPKELQGQIDAIFATPSAPAVKTVPPGQIAQAGQLDAANRTVVDAFLPGSAALSNAADPLATLGIDPNSFEQYVSDMAQSMQDLGNIYAGINYLRYLDGEKHLIFVSERGLALPRAEDDKGLAAVASDARVIIDVLHTGGVSPTFSWNVATAETIAEQTGGQFTGLSYGDKFVDRVDDSTRSEYVLGYSPANTTWDGKYRRIQVTVNRKGVTVLYRHGYYGREDVAPLDPARVVAETRISAAANYAPAITDIGVTATAANSKSAAGRLVTIRINIKASEIAFLPDDDVHAAKFNITVFCGDARQHVVGSTGQIVTLNSHDDVFARFQREGINVTISIPVKNLADYVKVIVYDMKADRLGSVVAKVK